MVGMGETPLAQSYAPGVGRKHKRSPIAQAADLTIKAMLLQGGSLRKIAAALHVSPTTVLAVKKRMLAQAPDAEDLKSSLMSSQRDQNAGKLIDHFIGKGLKMKKIKGSDALGAVKMYADRRWPVRSEAPPPARTFIQTNLNVFLPDPRPAALDAPVDTTCSVLGDEKAQETNNLSKFNTCSVR